MTIRRATCHGPLSIVDGVIGEMASLTGFPSIDEKCTDLKIVRNVALHCGYDEHILTNRPLDRQARTTEAVRSAVLDVLTRDGYAGLTIEKVAAVSGVAKTSIYRRWGSKAEMVSELTIHTEELTPPIDEGSLDADLRVLAAQVVETLTNELGRAVLPGLLVDLSKDADQLRKFQHTFIKQGSEVIAAIIDKAVERGELSAPSSPLDVQTMMLGTTYAWVHIFPATLPDNLVDRLVRMAIFQLGSGSTDLAKVNFNRPASR